MLAVIWAFRERWSLVTEHCNKYNFKQFEILQELLKCDTETQSEKMLLEKWCQLTCSTKGLHKPSICKKKCNYLQSAIKWSTIKRGVPASYCPVLTLDLTILSSRPKEKPRVRGLTNCITQKPLALLLMIMMWDDKMPTWDEVRWTTQVLWPSIRLLLTSDLGQEEDYLLLAHG